jgi:hypothetical protein
MNDAYAAGLFDGEGLIGVYPVDEKNWGVKLQLVGAYRPMIEAVSEYFGVGSFGIQKRQMMHRAGDYAYEAGQCKQGWRWFVTSRKEVELVGKRIYPFLIEKRDQMQVALAYCSGAMSGADASVMCRELKRVNFPADDFVPRGRKNGGAYGAANPFAKLTDEQVLQMRQSYDAGQSIPQIAESQQVSRHCAYMAITARSYVDVSYRISRPLRQRRSL